jgi:iron-sulfur cluster assembly accessory protein
MRNNFLQSFQRVLSISRHVSAASSRLSPPARRHLAITFSSVPSSSASPLVGGEAPGAAFLSEALLRGTSGDLVLTPNALSRLSALRARARAEGRADADSLVLRIRVDSGGCSGFRYEFSVVEAAKTLSPDDAAFGREGCYAVIDASSLALLKGATIDWDDSLMRSAFCVMSNPNADASCGCKMSFSPKAL